MNQNFNYYN